MDALKEQIDMLRSDKESLQEQNKRLEEKNDQLTSEILTINKRLLEAPKEEKARHKKFLGIF